MAGKNWKVTVVLVGIWCISVAAVFILDNVGGLMAGGVGGGAVVLAFARGWWEPEKFVDLMIGSILVFGICIGLVNLTYGLGLLTSDAAVVREAGLFFFGGLWILALGGVIGHHRVYITPLCEIAGIFREKCLT